VALDEAHAVRSSRADTERRVEALDVADLELEAAARGERR
jgi:hypothetical protein